MCAIYFFAAVVGLLSVRYGLQVHSFFVLCLRSIQLCEGSWLWRGKPRDETRLSAALFWVLLLSKRFRANRTKHVHSVRTWIVCG